MRGGRAERERERDVGGGERRTEKSGTRKDGEIEGRTERTERLDKERAERKAERSEDWRRGEFSTRLVASSSVSEVSSSC